MKQLSIKQQIVDIRAATACATKSPAAALKFLIDAGIIKKSARSKKNSIKAAAKK